MVHFHDVPIQHLRDDAAILQNLLRYAEANAQWLSQVSNTTCDLGNQYRTRRSISKRKRRKNVEEN